MKQQTIKEVKSISWLALPIIAENILQTLLGTTDTYFAGQIADNAIAAISVTNLIMNLFLSVFTAVSVGATVVISRSYGKKDFEQANRFVFHSIVLAMAIGILFGAFGCVFRVPILQLSGANPSLAKYAMPYYCAVAVPCVFLCLQLVVSACLRAVKDTKSPMLATVVSNLLNIAFNVLFVKMGFGLLGLGLATTLSRMVGLLILLVKLWTHPTLKLKRCILTKHEMHHILQIGIPAGLEKAIMRVGQLVYNAVILTIGISAYVAHNVAGTIESYAYIPAMGFGLAVCTAVGVSLGENNMPQAKRQTMVGYWISALVMSLMGIVFFVFAPQLAALFSDTPEVQQNAANVLRLIAFFQPFSALVQIMTNALQGAGDTKYPMYSTLLGIWGIRIGIGYTLISCTELGLMGIWIAYALDVTVRGILLAVRFFSISRKSTVAAE